MTELRAAANRAAQDAIRACHEYRIKHGAGSTPLDAAYEASERMVEAVEEYERLYGLAHDGAEDAWEASVSIGRYIIVPDVPLADMGDHFAGMPR